MFILMFFGQITGVILVDKVNPLALCWHSYINPKRLWGSVWQSQTTTKSLDLAQQHIPHVSQGSYQVHLPHGQCTCCITSLTNCSLLTVWSEVPATSWSCSAGSIFDGSCCSHSNIQPWRQPRSECGEQGGWLHCDRLDMHLDDQLQYDLFVSTKDSIYCYETNHNNPLSLF